VRRVEGVGVDRHHPVLIETLEGVLLAVGSFEGPKTRVLGDEPIVSEETTNIRVTVRDEELLASRDWLCGELLKLALRIGVG
jgi:hypothetical protein